MTETFDDDELVTSTLQDFEDAPVGATAGDGKWVKYRPTNPDWPEWVKADWATAPNSNLAFEGIALDPLPGTPTTAREALDLAWELAHPVKKGQEIPPGTEYMYDEGDCNLMIRKASGWTPLHPERVRTLDHLPEPEPDWLGAPAVLAWSRADDLRREKVWSEINDGWYRSLDGEVVTWPDLEGVTPLWPKEDA